jgi:hypothetical protein
MARSKGSNVRHFHTKIAGVTHKNADGSDRQKLIAKCQVFETLELDHEENNAHDPNAVRVCRQNGHQLGYLGADLAEEIVRKSAKGYRFAAVIKGITGGKRKGQSFGVNLLIVQADPNTNDRQVKKYLKKLIQEDPELTGAKLKSGCSAKVVMVVLAIVVGAILYFYLSGRK